MSVDDVSAASRIVVVPYDDRWPTSFEEERARLAELFTGASVTIEHVGSTAVRGLAAKPIIDIMIGLSALDEATNRLAALEAIGYQYVPEYERQLPERRYFRRPTHRPRSHHVHCVLESGHFWERHLAFRDYLRGDRETMLAYGALKTELAARHPTDRARYTSAKSPFIESVLGRIEAPASRPRPEAVG